MLLYITVLVLCQLAGEIIVRGLAWPVPGPVMGMALLFVGLLIRRDVPDDLEKVANGFLSHLALMFVPAGTGVILYLGVMAHEIVPIAAALVVGTAITIAVTGWLMMRLSKKGDL